MLIGLGELPSQGEELGGQEEFRGQGELAGFGEELGELPGLGEPGEFVGIFL
jgi:hypothetical protein